MNKRMVVLLDGSDYGRTALAMGLRRAKLYRGVLVGVAVIDAEQMEKQASGAPPGAIFMARESVTRRITEAQKQADQLIREFEEECRKSKVRFESYVKTGSLLSQLLEETLTADLLILGLRIQTQPADTAQPWEHLRDLLQHTVCPVIAVTSELELPDRVIIAYDGSEQAAKAMKAFAQMSAKLPFRKNTILLNVNENSEAGMAILRKAEDYLKLHRFKAQKVVRAGEPSEVIYEMAREQKRTGVVIGAYGRSGLSKLFFGSSARRLLQDGSIPLFVYH